MADRKEDMCAEQGRKRDLQLTLSTWKKPKKYQIHPVKNAHIFCRPVEITTRGSMPRTGKTKMK